VGVEHLFEEYICPCAIFLFGDFITGVDTGVLAASSSSELELTMLSLLLLLESEEGLLIDGSPNLLGC
jgi:hypothetical protein